MLSFLRKNRRLLLTLAFTVGGVLIGATKIFAVDILPTTMAAVGSPSQIALYAVGGIISAYVQAIGSLAVSAIGILISVAQYNNFVNAPAVVEGWVIIRDVVNMFFILILLVIAFATIFNVQEYKYQKMLPRLLIMAVVINFSRTIAGVMIDFGQVVMLTFVNGFKAAAGGNFINALKINELLKFNPNTAPEGTEIKYIFASFILAALIITVTLVVLVVMIIILIMRIVTLWFLIVLSPIAFMSSVWPGGKLKANYGKWWDMFIDNVTVGPIMAFFLWLSLLVLGNGNIGSDIAVSSGVNPGEMPSVGMTQIGTFENMISYLMGLGMLLGTLYMTKSMQSAGGGIAGSVLGKMQGYATSAVRKTAMAPVRGARAIGGAAVGAAWEKSGGRAYKDALVSSFRGGKFGKFIGAGTKEYKDAEAALRSEKALRAVGQTSKADALRTKLEVAEQRSISEKGLTNDQVREKLAKEKDGVARAALARELASRGEMTSHSEFKKYAAGDQRLEFALRSNAQKAGIKSAFLGYQEGGKYLDPEKQFRAVLDRATNKGQKQSQFVGIKAGAMINEDGQMYQEFTHKMIGALTGDEYGSFDANRKKEIDDALLLAHQNTQDPAEKTKLEQKYNEFHGTAAVPDAWAANGATLMARQTELDEEQKKNVAGRRKEAQESGILKKSDIDKSAEQALTYGMSNYNIMGGTASMNALSNELNTALQSVSNMTDDTSANLAEQQLEAIRRTMEVIAQELDTEGRTTGQRAPDGHEMSNVEVMQASSIYKNVEMSRKMADEMATAMAGGAALDTGKRTAAANAVGVSARDMNNAALKFGGAAGVVTEDEYVRAIKNYKKTARKGREGIAAVPKISKESDRAKSAKIALKELADALYLLEQQGASFPGIATDIETLKQRIQSLRAQGAAISKVDIDALEDEFKNIDLRLS